MPADLSNSEFMRLALTQGRKALPHCQPNPPVGCILVKDGEIVAQGFTQPPGQHHAEAMALSQLAGDCRGITAYVTLEPCSFHGRTPSCAQALIKRGISQVFVGTLDPDPRNAGKGVEMLREAGVTVVVGLLQEEASADLADYLSHPEFQRRE